LATVTLLHWNIYQFSNNKVNNANGAALINYIAEVVSQAGPDIISILEMKNGAVNNIVARLIPAINIKNNEGPPALNQWRSISINSQKNHEAYVVLYRIDKGFRPLTAAVGGGTDPINALSNQTLLPNGTPGGVLRFNSSLTTNGGRKPYYVTFRTTDGKNFSIVAYHTMFGIHSPIGVRNVGELAQSRAILDNGVTVNMDASMISGDFNVDFDPLFPGPYNNLLAAVPSTQSTNAKTSLVNFTPPGGFPTSVEYRKNAYDNIFKYRRAGLPPALGGHVVDLINESTTLPVGTAFMAPEAGAFVPGPILDGNLIQNIPPRDFEDAWHIVRHAISDHLPIYVSLNF
jgi:hypothetical protein